MTNYERIKNMSVEEMAEFLDDVHSDGFIQGLDGSYAVWRDFHFDKQWLESGLKQNDRCRNY